MVAPTRTPQARGAKCDLCKEILLLATWVDQTKPADKIDSARTVLALFSKHDQSECPCIPKGIQNLLVGSTHFEIHRKLAKQLESHVYTQQRGLHVIEKKLKNASNMEPNINDCSQSKNNTRFKLSPREDIQDQILKSNSSLWHLKRSVYFWRSAMDDTINPFNSKLAFRLGLTHHVIYSCYLFKYHRILDYQLMSACLLLNLFRSIEGVTQNAVMHAYSLLIRSYMDADQLHLARQYLKDAKKLTNYKDKSHYESILLSCVSCELNLIDKDGCSEDSLDELASLAKVQPDDKLQHYYARTLAMSIVIKYIHHYLARSEYCYEFYHVFRLISGMMRRCYSEVFDIVILDKLSIHKQETKSSYDNDKSLVAHSWIKFAICDFVYSTFNNLSSFYIRSGQPECLELLHNALVLICNQNGSVYWQAKILSIGLRLDVLCDKLDHAKAKLHEMDKLLTILNDPSELKIEIDSTLNNIISVNHEVSSLVLDLYQGQHIDHSTSEHIMQRLNDIHASYWLRLSIIELFDSKNCTTNRCVKTCNVEKDIMRLGCELFRLNLQVIKMEVISLVRVDRIDDARQVITKLANQLINCSQQLIDYNARHDLIEILIQVAGVETSSLKLLDTVIQSSQVLSNTPLESQLSLLSISEPATTKVKSTKYNPRTMTKTSKMSLLTRSRRQKYAIASGKGIRYFDTIEAYKNFNDLTPEELIACYLRNSEPNPDYLIYRQAHELMYCLHLGCQKDYQVLYHFCESTTSNTMRYRWMALEEQSHNPYDSTFKPTNRQSTPIKHLGFTNTIVDVETYLKSMTQALPSDEIIVQMKFIIDNRTQSEHLIAAIVDTNCSPFYIHTSRKIGNDDFFLDTAKDAPNMTLPMQFYNKIEEAKKTLLYTNYRQRTSQRARIEEDLESILSDIENDLLSCFRWILCGRVSDVDYQAFVKTLSGELVTLMGDQQCTSMIALEIMLENAPLLTRAEFIDTISALFNLGGCNELARESYDRWLKAIEANITNGTCKRAYLHNLQRGQVGLILDKSLELIPFESIKLIRGQRIGMFRTPSLRLHSIIASRSLTSVKLDPGQLAYMLDPENNLIKTRERFQSKLGAHSSWAGSVGVPPTTEALEQWLTDRQIYLFIGHGAGSAYYNKLCKGRGLGAMRSVRPAAIVMGCSSGRVLAEGPRLESFGVSWLFVLRGAPAYVGLLWDVTDTDIDRFLCRLMSEWLHLSDWDPSGLAAMSATPVHPKPTKSHSRASPDELTNAVAAARVACELRLLVGSTPVVYGLPVQSRRPLDPPTTARLVGNE